MSTIIFSTSRDHGHYYGSPGYEITVTGGHVAAKSNRDLMEIHRLMDLHQNGTAVVGVDVMAGLLEEARADLAILEDRIAAANNSSGTLTVFEGKPYIEWEFPLGNEKLHAFLQEVINYDGAVSPMELLAELRQRHTFETPLEFTDRGWSYTTWSGTILIHDEAKAAGVTQPGADMTISIRLPLYRAIHEDGRKGFHFQLLD